MPIRGCHGWAEIQSTSVRQLATRPERIPSVAVKKNCVEEESRIQYISTNGGNTFHVIHAAAATDAAIGATRERRMRRRFHHARTISETSTFRSEAREPPTSRRAPTRVRDDTGEREQRAGREGGISGGRGRAAGASGHAPPAQPAAAKNHAPPPPRSSPGPPRAPP